MKVLTLSRKAIDDLIIFQEVTSQEYYDQKLKRPIWPGGESGVTIGVGYDLGFVNELEFQLDWGRILTPTEMNILKKYLGKKGKICKEYLPINVSIGYHSAKNVFFRTSLRRAAIRAASVYPELETLHPYEQTAIVGLVYNRGSSLRGERRKEMADLVQAIKDDDDKVISSLIRQMKRLWGKELRGLQLRRDLEAKYVDFPDTTIPDEDKLLIEV